MKNLKIKTIDGWKKRRYRYPIVNVSLVMVIVGLAIAIMTYGNTSYPLATVVRVLLGEDIKGATFTIMNLRLPALLTGSFVGLAFGIAGNTFQTLLRNDLASPDIIGVTSGSSAAAVFCILILRMSGIVVSMISLVAGLGVAVFIYLLSLGQGPNKGRLILIGIGAQAMLHAFTSFVLLKSAQYDVATALRWLNGSLNGVQLDRVPSLAFVVIALGLIIVINNRHLQVMQLGEEMAATLGVSLHVTSVTLIFAAVFLTAFATSITGPIASVAFLSGPIAARLVGKSQVNTITSGLVGVVLVLASYLAGQYFFAVRYPVGVITGVLGAPYMLWLLIRMNRKAEE